MPTVVSKTTNYVTTYDEFVNCDTTLGGFSVTLPTAIAASGKMLTVRKTSADLNLVTVLTVGGQLINGSSTLEIVGQYTAIVLISDGVNWAVT